MHMYKFPSSLFRGQGMAGLYKGVTMNWIKGPVAVATSFTINDTLKQMLRDNKVVAG